MIFEGRAVRVERGMAGKRRMRIDAGGATKGKALLVTSGSQRRAFGRSATCEPPMNGCKDALGRLGKAVFLRQQVINPAVPHPPSTRRKQ